MQDYHLVKKIKLAETSFNINKIVIYPQWKTFFSLEESSQVGHSIAN